MTTVLENIIEKCADNLRFQDPVSDINTHPAKISISAQQQVTQLLQQLSQEKIQQAAEQVFGELVTEPRYFLSDECVDEVSEQNFHSLLNQIISECSVIPIYLSVSTRLAFSTTCLFVNGIAYPVSESFAENVCDGEIVIDNMDKNERLVLITLLEQGDISLSE